ncbi:MAG: hypothetical protein NTU41_01610, partial [Chloroflexi bacterium]|nr:hypothetical protein [Chloroflexota bacterium]
SIDQAKRALEVFLKGMQTGMLFNIYRFGSTYKKLFPDSIAYDSSNLDRALQLLHCVDADLGGTELLGALRDIYGRATPEGCTRSIILITDGQVGNESEIIELALSDRRTRLFVVGIGHGPNEYLVKKTASMSGGASEFVAPGERIEPKVLRLFNKVAAGGVDEVRVDWNAVAEQAPLKPVVYQGECVSIFARLPAGAIVPAQVEMSGMVNGVAMKWQVSISQVDGVGIALPLLWARNRISDLEDETAGTAGSRQRERRDWDAKGEIVAISRHYGLLSRETSFVAVESRVGAEKTKGETVLRRVPAMLTKDWGGYEIAGRQLHPTILRKHMSRLHFGDGHVAMDIGWTPRLSDGISERPSVEPAVPELLADILASQTADGGFLITSLKQANRVGLDITELRGVAAKINTVGGVDSFKLVCTAVILALLEMEFNGRRGEWYAVTVKSRRWFKEQVEHLKPTVDGIALAEWAERFIKQHSPDGLR